MAEHTHTHTYTPTRTLTQEPLLTCIDSPLARHNLKVFDGIFLSPSLALPLSASLFYIFFFLHFYCILHCHIITIFLPRTPASFPLAAPHHNSFSAFAVFKCGFCCNLEGFSPRSFTLRSLAWKLLSISYFFFFFL